MTNDLYSQALARLAEMFPRPSAMRIRPSASIVPWRRRVGKDVEVYWVQRSKNLGVLGGWHAFPGGGVDKIDADVPIAGHPVRDPSLQTNFPLYDLTQLEDDLTQAVIVGSLRELFEETGLLLTVGGSLPGYEYRERVRREIAERKINFVSWLREHQLTLDAGRLVFAGRWVTPPVAPIRFDTRFFLLEWPDSEIDQPTVDGAELAHGEWISAKDAIELWRSHQVLAAPPTLFFLEVLAMDGPADGLKRLVRHGAEPIHPNRRFLELRPGVIALPLVTPTLPPARETISYLVGKDEVVLIDLGSPFPEEVNRLVTLIKFLGTDFGKKLKAIWLTHHHPDHLGGVELFLREIDVPVLAHPDSAKLIREHTSIKIDGELNEGDEHVLASDGSFRVRVLATPGHARGHICIFEPTHQTLIAGDLVSGRGTIMIDPPDGNMIDYLNSLERVLALHPKILLPAHGPAILDGAQHLRQLIEHRLAREEKVFASWQQGKRDLASIVSFAYPEADAMLQPFAERQALAHLERLDSLGKIKDFQLRDFPASGFLGAS